MTKLQQIIEAAEAATPGPWESEGTQVWNHIDCQFHQIADLFWGSGCRLQYEAEDTAKYIALANPATVMQMARLMEQMAEALEEVIDRAVETNPVWQVGYEERACKALAAFEEFNK